MNFSILSQFFGLTSGPQSDLTGRLGQGHPAGSAQGATASPGQQIGDFATLLQALGLTSGQGIAEGVTGALAPGGNMKEAGFLQTAQPLGNGVAATVPTESIATLPQNPEGAGTLVIRRQDGTTLTLDAARLAEMVKGTASDEEMALFAQTPLGQLLQQEPQLRNLLTGDAPDLSNAVADLPATLDDNDRAMMLAAMALVAPQEGEQQALPTGEPSTAPSQKTVAPPQAVNVENSASGGHPPAEEVADVTLPDGTIPAATVSEEGTANDVTVLTRNDSGAAIMPAATSDTAPRRVNTATMTEDPAPGNPAAARGGETREAQTSADPSCDADMALPESLAADAEPDAEHDTELPQALAAARNRRAGSASANAGDAQPSGSTVTSSSGSEKSAGATVARENNAPAAEMRRPAQQTASDMLALLRSDWGSGWSDGWIDPRDNAGMGANLSGLSALSLGGTGAAKPAAQPLSYNFAGPVVANQVALQISRSVQNGTDSFQIRLDPPELGRVDVKLEIAHDGRVSAVVAVDNDQTLQMLLRDQGVLERALQEAGLKTDSGSLNFSLSQGGERDEAPAQQGQHANGARDQRVAATAEAAAPQPVYLSDRALDLRV